VRRRQHVNPLGLGLSTRRPAAVPLPTARTLEVEIGCADAQFLFERAQRHPHHVYVGLDIRHQLVNEVNRRAHADAQPVIGVMAHANRHLEELFRPASVARAYINFPDPWFKRRHRKRRMFDAELADSIHVILAPGGQLWLQTDVWAIALAAMAVLDGDGDRFRNLAGPWSFWRSANPFSARSWREQHCESAGLPIWRLFYEKA